MSTPSLTIAPDSPPMAWRVGEHATHMDPLLDCVVAVARIFGIATTHESLSAGLPLEDNRITPALIPRAAARAGMTARLARRARSIAAAVA